MLKAEDKLKVFAYAFAGGELYCCEGWLSDTGRSYVFWPLGDLNLLTQRERDIFGCRRVHDLGLPCGFWDKANSQTSWIIWMPERNDELARKDLLEIYQEKFENAKRDFEDAFDTINNLKAIKINMVKGKENEE